MVSNFKHSFLLKSICKKKGFADSFQLPNKTKLFFAVKNLSVNILNNKTVSSRFLSVEEISPDIYM